ncbi:MAG TPA: TonB-dependent receptor [Caulobacteraceae bacterium]|nr:TonB-dependent receptor [Caulobacteraceae bacterium]
MRFRVVGGRVAIAAAGALAASAAQAQTDDNLQGLSLSELSNLPVSSATKTSQPVSDAPAALYVITHDEIVRSGANTIPEILRLAPNLFVAQTSAHSFVVTARGFAGNVADQSFANKLLVLIDGRTVYNPLFSGVDWDAQDVLPEDIDRIEVISGPGATLWGANAVNGVINIITRKSYQTQGGLIDASLGANGEALSVRYGGRISDDLTYRAYIRDFAIGDTATAAGADARDHWFKPQGGFQFDWTPSAADAVTVQGDGYDGYEAQPTGPDANLNGFNLNAHWDHVWADGAESQVQTYFTRAARGPDATGGSPYWYDSYDFDVQHDFALGARQRVVIGGGVRQTWYHISPLSNFFYLKPAGTLLLSDIFGQDAIALTPRLSLILGLKAEDDPYSGVSLLPSVRVSWRVDPQWSLWASAQRAIRSPTPFDEDPVEEVGGKPFLVGNPNFASGTLNAYEIGARGQLFSRLSLSASVFYNDYDNLRTIEFSPGPALPLTWGNLMSGYTEGLEAWGDFQATDWWRLSAGVDVLAKHLSFKPGSSRLLGVAQAGDDPPSQASLRSAMNLGHDVTLDTMFRYVSALPDPLVPSYGEMDVSLTWNLTRHLQLGVAGFNLLHDHHLEFAAPQATEVPRTGQAQLRWRF